MKHLLKQFTAWATSWQNNVFTKARIRLTFYYTLVMVVIISVFSVFLYITLMQDIQNNVEYSIDDEETQLQVISETADSLQLRIIFIDGLLLVLIASLSYVLARKTLKPIALSLEMQKRFSADASHDLRTPLAIMQTDIEVTLDGKNIDIKQLKKTLESNLEEIKKMSYLTENLLALSRTETPNKEILKNKIDLSLLVERSIAKFQEQAKIKHITLKFDSNKDKKEGEKDVGLVYGVMPDLERVIYNVIGNAVNYTREGGSINVLVIENRDNIEIVVSDTGIGISIKDLPFVFERFYKASNWRNEHNLGSGLGLSIARKIVEAHRGTISIKSEINKGTIVSIVIPKNS